MYAIYHGPKGLKDIAQRVHDATLLLAEGNEEFSRCYALILVPVQVYGLALSHCFKNGWLNHFIITVITLPQNSCCSLLGTEKGMFGWQVRYQGRIQDFF